MVIALDIPECTFRRNIDIIRQAITPMILIDLLTYLKTVPWHYRMLRDVLPGSILLAAISGPALALDSNTQTAIRDTIQNYLTQEVVSRYKTQPEVTVRRLDPRLQLKACNEPLTASVRRGSKLAGITTVAVSCAGQNNWKIYVQAEVKVLLDIVVADAMLERGQVISEGDLAIEPHDIGNLPQGYFDDTGKVAGMITRRVVKPGDLINSNMLKQAYMVKRGESVSLVVKTPGLQVRMKGKALGNATRGNTVRVKNLSSNRIVEGVATAPGVVSISLN